MFESLRNLQRLLLHAWLVGTNLASWEQTREELRHEVDQQTRTRLDGVEVEVPVPLLLQTVMLFETNSLSLQRVWTLSRRDRTKGLTYLKMRKLLQEVEVEVEVQVLLV
jgi:hypothetical protein